MALITPSISLVKPFSSTQSQTFKFSVSSASDQVVRNNLVIENNTTNVEVYNQSVESFQLQHILPINTLTNGQEFRAHIKTGNISNEWSNFSDWIYFYVLSSPTITIDSVVDGKVNNSTINFSSTYTQLESELLQSYKYLLYDSNQNLIQTYSEQFSDGSTPLTQEITGLENNVLYHIEVKTISIHGQEGSSDLIPFRPFFIAPRLLTTLNVENLQSQGAIKLSCQLIQEIGKVDSGTIQYVDNDWIDLTLGQISFQEGFSLGSDFVLKLWCKNIPDDKVFLRLVSEYGRLELIKYNNLIHAFKYLTNSTIYSHFSSNSLVVGTDVEFMIYLQSLNNALEIAQQLVV